MTKTFYLFILVILFFFYYFRFQPKMIYDMRTSYICSIIFVSRVFSIITNYEFSSESHFFIYNLISYSCIFKKWNVAIKICDRQGGGRGGLPLGSRGVEGGLPPQKKLWLLCQQLKR